MSEKKSRLTVLLLLREYLANVEVVPGVAGHREAIVLVHNLLRSEVLIGHNWFLRQTERERRGGLLMNNGRASRTIIKQSTSFLAMLSSSSVMAVTTAGGAGAFFFLPMKETIHPSKNFLLATTGNLDSTSSQLEQVNFPSLMSRSVRVLVLMMSMAHFRISSYPLRFRHSLRRSPRSRLPSMTRCINMLPSPSPMPGMRLSWLFVCSLTGLPLLSRWALG